MKIIALTLALLVATTYASEVSYGFPKGRVVGGHVAIPNQFPHQVSIQWVLFAMRTHICGGSIISPIYVLTAAHCSAEAPSVGRLVIVAGAHNIAVNETSQQTREIARTDIHSEYQGGVGPHDIALIRLAAPLTLNSFVSVIALPVQDRIYTGVADLSGWGSTSSTNTPSMPNLLHTVTKSIIEHAECLRIVGPATPLHENNICTGPVTGGISACSGDSGGPLTYNQGAYPVVIGIVSWGWMPCGSVNAPSVFVRVSAYADWINSHMLA